MDVFIWIAAFVIFSSLEAATVCLVCVWFVGGSVAGFIAALFHAPLWLQCALFFAVSVALLLCLRPFLKKYVNPRKIKTNVDALAGQQAVVTQAIDNLQALGAIRLNGAEWTARSLDSQPIPQGTVVTVERIEGVKAFVQPVDVPARK